MGFITVNEVKAAYFILVIFHKKFLSSYDLDFKSLMSCFSGKITWFLSHTLFTMMWPKIGRRRPIA